MNRVAALVLLIGGALLLSWAVAPATSGPAPQGIAPATVDRKPSRPSQNMTAEVARLRERLATVPEFPEPSRDPFRFGGRAMRAAAVPPPAEPMPVEPVAPVLPRLVALMDDGAPGAPLWRAVMAIGDDVRIVKVGETVGGFSVKGVGADGVELVDPASQRSFRLHLK
jgi:hypothetical protein